MDVEQVEQHRVVAQLLRTTRGQSTVIVIIKRLAVADHLLADVRGGGDMVGQLATEHRKQAVGMSDCAADRRRVGAGGDVEFGGDQLIRPGSYWRPREPDVQYG